jgi:hypothetical protein
MIQRPQSILLFAATLSIVATFLFPFWTSGEGATHYFLTAFETGQLLEDGSTTVLKVNYHIFGMGLVVIASMVFAIFKYKNRLLQMKICSATSLLIGGYVVVVLMWAIPEARELANADGKTFWVAFIPVLGWALVAGAKYSIKRDEKLVRSVDRMR